MVGSLQKRLVHLVQESPEKLSQLSSFKPNKCSHY